MKSPSNYSKDLDLEILHRDQINLKKVEKTIMQSFYENCGVTFFIKYTSYNNPDISSCLIHMNVNFFQFMYNRDWSI